jgi:hypothetical protein
MMAAPMNLQTKTGPCGGLTSLATTCGYLCHLEATTCSGCNPSIDFDTVRMNPGHNKALSWCHGSNHLGDCPVFYPSNGGGEGTRRSVK